MINEIDISNILLRYIRLFSRFWLGRGHPHSSLKKGEKMGDESEMLCFQNTRFEMISFFFFFFFF
jgi:hypothetical protein